MPRTADGTGKSYLAHLVRYEVPEKAPAVAAIALAPCIPPTRGTWFGAG